MKILFISMPSVHVVRWVENLKETNHELYWFDVLDKGKLETTQNITQFTGWKKRKIRSFKGEYFLRKKIPFLYNIIQPYVEIIPEEYLKKIIQEINPDVIHSFEMQSCSYQILKTMNKYPNLKWIYSCWGNDLYYYQNFKNHLTKIKNVLARVNYLHTDCNRDFEIAKQLGFSGDYLGLIPGGTGYKIDSLMAKMQPFSDRKVILVKGYQHIFGRGLIAIKALQSILSHLGEYQVIVFGTHPEVIDYVNRNNLPFKIYDRHALQHNDLLELMGKSLLYIGNSISDGMANTLLEAIVMGAFQIQSNPGGVSSEIIDNFHNGLLINDPEDAIEISNHVIFAINNRKLLQDAFYLNKNISINRLDYYLNQQKVIDLYAKIE